MKEKKKNSISRRTFLAVSGGTGAGLLLQSQKKYIHKLIPYINAPHYPKPGEWAQYLTTCRECPAGCGMMMWHRDGHVTKAEGNPESPLNRGKLCIRGQSSVLGQYDTDRLTRVLSKNQEGAFAQTSWNEALITIRKELANATDVRLISDLQTGSLARVMNDFAARYNQKPLFYEAFNYESLRRANAEMYGRPLIPRYNLAESDLIVSFGVNFLETWLSPVEFARQYSDFHALNKSGTGKSIYLGPAESMTALNCDEFVITEAGIEAQLIAGLINRVAIIKGIPAPTHDLRFSKPLPDALNKKLDAIADEISHARHPVILAGRPEDKSNAGKLAVKAANILNEMLENRSVVNFAEHHALSNAAFSEEVEQFFSTVTTDTVLIVHHTNPAYTQPDLTEHLSRASKIVYIGTMLNETAQMAHWVLPMNYSLEEWGDYEAWKGTVSLLQPTMMPLFDTRSAGDILLTLGENNPGINYSDIVKNNWRKWAPGDESSSVMSQEVNGVQVANQPGSDEFYNRLLKKGYLLTSTGEEEPIQPIDHSPVWSQAETTEAPPPPGENHFYLHLSASHFFYDGALANRGWLQEIPHAVTNIVWQSWVDMNVEKAREMKIEEGDVLKLKAGEKTIEVAVRLTNQMGRNTLALEAGQGHTSLGKIANGVGVNAFDLMQNDNGRVPVVEIEKTRNHETLLYLNATKDQHHRELLQHEKLEAIKQGTAKTEEMNWPLPEGYKPETDLYKGHDHKNHRWGMVIDLQKCIGCKACEAACYAENNIPVVGKENCREGREMSWMKVVPYYLDDGQTAWLPTLCQHCDSAPCEPVCPVYAAVHNEEGLNAQIYNRCIGTRYCSNNCPYKVRRFNWINVKHEYPMTLQLNPEVTVRERGVMEKCTFCVQRIRNKQYQAKIENRELTDGEIMPACAQTCPTGAITFGDLMDENSRIRNMIAEDPRRYQLLNELNTKTAIVYLKKITI